MELSIYSSPLFVKGKKVSDDMGGKVNTLDLTMKRDILGLCQYWSVARPHVEMLQQSVE